MKRLGGDHDCIPAIIGSPRLTLEIWAISMQPAFRLTHELLNFASSKHRFLSRNPTGEHLADRRWISGFLFVCRS
ncbi:hypothetical protein CEXT_39311 [Caerostris extrusa]|uniref:Uncharacterized protein n=1 Tax=Caerostris extrusa TaxID=172846 RepID=A0AAV4UVH1_CAEEX|nr:hypothetical protein CEXT_39311 [Caerostris extrusa]